MIITVLPYGLGSDGKIWIDPIFHTVDGRRRGRKRTKQLRFECFDLIDLILIDFHLTDPPEANRCLSKGVS